MTFNEAMDILVEYETELVDLQDSVIENPQSSYDIEYNYTLIQQIEKKKKETELIKIATIKLCDEELYGKINNLGYCCYCNRMVDIRKKIIIIQKQKGKQ